MMKFLKIMMVVYPLVMIFTFGSTAVYFRQEAIETCNKKKDCYSFDMQFRGEALFFTLIWPYYWSERAWEGAK